MPESTEAQSIIDAALAGAEPSELTDRTSYGFVVPLGHQVTQVHVDQEAWLNQPRRRQGKVTLRTAESFSRLVKDLGPEHGAVRLYANLDGVSVTAVFNDHKPASAGWQDHRAILQMRRTPEWVKWTEHDGKLRSQTEFAEMIEDQLDDIVEPPGADLLELAQTFQAHTKVEFKSSRMLDNGQVQVTYNETTESKAGQKGDIVIPKVFVLGIQPFEGSERFKVQARLRYRVADGILKLGYRLDRPERVERSAFDAAVAEIAAATEIEPYLATAP